MTAPGLLDFFVLEASEYLEQLDRALAGGASAPDLDAVQRAARGLRGSATMAKLAPFAELAGMVERVARAAREGAVAWTPAIGGAMVGAVDELKILLHAARTWSDDETARARTRTAELMRLLPDDAERQAPASGGRGVGYLSNETANVAAGLEFLLTAPGGGGDAGIQVLQRIRALRGIAGIRDVPALPDALEAAEQAATPFEQGRPLADAQRNVLRIAARLLRDLALAIRAGRAVAPESVHELEQALDEWLDQEDGAGSPIVAIESLFHADAGPHVVTATPNPPTTAAQRFQLEMVSNGEHLRLLVEEARAADPGARARYRRHIRRSLREIRRTAESFGETEVAEVIGRIAATLSTVDDDALDRLAHAARTLSSPAAGGAGLAELLERQQPEGQQPEQRQLEQTSEVHQEQPSERQPQEQRPEAVPAVALPESVPGAAVPARRPTPAGAELAVLLDRSVSAVGTISAQPLADPAALADAPIVPVAALLYRGKAALHRALELRNEMREAGGAPDPAAIDELFDLIELALVD